MKEPRRSPLALALLSLLIEEPMHPYRMQQLIRQRGKAKVVNVGGRGNLYKTIDRLRRDGLIVARETLRDSQFPDRTVYEATEFGDRTAKEWLREMLSAPRKEYPEFTAAVAHMALLDPADAAAQLSKRRDSLRADLDRQEQELATAARAVPRPFLLEDECIRAVTAAELDWLDGVVDDLRTGRLAWTFDWTKQVAAQLAEVNLPEIAQVEQPNTTGDRETGAGAAG